MVNKRTKHVQHHWKLFHVQQLFVWFPSHTHFITSDTGCAQSKKCWLTHYLMFCQMNVLRWSYPIWSYTHANTLSILKKYMYHVTTMKKGYNFLKVKLYTLYRKKINLKKKFAGGGGWGWGGSGSQICWIWAFSLTINFAGYHCGESNSLQ